MSVDFIKMHGLGNDFIFIRKDHFTNNVDISDFVVKYSNRKTGIGCDQLIFYEPGNNYTEMEIYNSDGSKAGACGNATRCLAYIISKDSHQTKIDIKVRDRILECKVNSMENVSVNMGEVEFHKEWMPEPGSLSDFIKEYLSGDSEFICADIGNMHLVIIDDKLSDKDMDLLGPKLEKSPLFPEGVNVNFAKLRGDIIDLKVWERGTGFTLACGSGACATFASCLNLGYGSKEMCVNFELGSLKMRLEDGIIMSGPVSLVAKGALL